VDCQGFCGQPIADGASVYRGWLRPRWLIVDTQSQPAAGSIRAPELSVCAVCAWQFVQQHHQPSWTSIPKPCFACGRPIFFDTRAPNIRYPVCGDRACRHEAEIIALHDWRRSRLFHAANYQRSCKRCGLWFEPKHANAFYCSGTCRRQA
jgi:hypothetical protein